MKKSYATKPTKYTQTGLVGLLSLLITALVPSLVVAQTTTDALFRDLNDLNNGTRKAGEPALARVIGQLKGTGVLAHTSIITNATGFVHNSGASFKSAGGIAFGFTLRNSFTLSKSVLVTHGSSFIPTLFAGVHPT